MDTANLKRPSTKWLFVVFFNVDFKVVLDRQPLLGTGPLQDWLRNLAHTRSMMALDTFNDNLCLWRCISVHQGSFPHRSKEAARQLAIRFLKLVSLVPENLPKTSLELENVEKHLNRKRPFLNLIGSGFEYSSQSALKCHGTSHPPAKLTKTLKSWQNFMNANTATTRFTQAGSLQHHSIFCSKRETFIGCRLKKSKSRGQIRKSLFPQAHEIAWVD